MNMLPYTIHKIHIGEGDQFTPEYVAIDPNSKIPAIHDRDVDTYYQPAAVRFCGSALITR